jgi:membrane-associated protease RseP (regulator of RpoE activity)
MQQGPGASNTEGAVIGRVVPGTPAEKAGLRSGDVITRIDDRPVRDAGQVTEAVRRAGVGKEIALTVQRGDSSKTYHVKLEAPPRGEGMGGFGGPPPMMGGPGMQPGMGGGMMRPGAQQMERRIDQLEQRVRELEQKVNKERPEK